MFLDVKMIKVILPIRDLRGHLVQVARSPCQVKIFPVLHGGTGILDSVPSPITSQLQSRTAVLTLITDMYTVSFHNISKAVAGRKGNSLKSVM